MILGYSFGTDANDPALYSDLQLRYAKAFNDRFAFKVNAGYIQGSDLLTKRRGTKRNVDPTSCGERRMT